MEVWWLYVYLCVYMSTSEPVTLKLDLIKGIHGFLDFSGRGACVLLVNVLLFPCKKIITMNIPKMTLSMLNFGWRMPLTRQILMSFESLGVVCTPTCWMHFQCAFFATNTISQQFSCVCWVYLYMHGDLKRSKAWFVGILIACVVYDLPLLH